MNTPDFVQNGQLTPAGRQVIEHIEAVIRTAESLVEGQNLTPLNDLAGHYQHYWVNVQKARILTPEQWLKDYRYAATMAYNRVLEQEQAAQKEEKVDTMADRLERLEAQLAQVLTALAAKAEPVETPAAEAVEPDAAPAKAPKGKKNQPEPEAPAAVADAEEAAETDEQAE